jgi:hypothetical protein
MTTTDPSISSHPDCAEGQLETPLGDSGTSAIGDQRLDSKVFQERSILQVRRVKRVALAEVAGLVAAAEPLQADFVAGVWSRQDDRRVLAARIRDDQGAKAAGRRAAEDAVFQKALAGLC